MNDEMVEAVARAICAVNCGGCGVIDRRTVTCGDGWQACTNEARAAIAAITPMIREEERERCAKVAEERATRARDNADTVKSGGFVDAMLNTSAAALDEIAAAIRSMGEKP